MGGTWSAAARWVASLNLGDAQLDAAMIGGAGIGRVDLEVDGLPGRQLEAWQLSLDCGFILDRTSRLKI